MSRAPRQAQQTPGDQEPGTQPRDVAPSGRHQLAVEDARRIAQALSAAGQPVPPDIQARLEEADAANSTPSPVVDAEPEA